MPNPVVLMAFGASLVLAVADELPSFSVEASCKAVEGFGLAIEHSLESCVNDENAAKSELRQKWSSYPSAARSRCCRPLPSTARMSMWTRWTSSKPWCASCGSANVRAER